MYIRTMFLPALPINLPILTFTFFCLSWSLSSSWGCFRLAKDCGVILPLFWLDISKIRLQLISGWKKLRDFALIFPQLNIYISFSSTKLRTVSAEGLGSCLHALQIVGSLCLLSEQGPSVELFHLACWALVFHKWCLNILYTLMNFSCKCSCRERLHIPAG